ncbi:MAG: type I glyceraldehyde-3-phosphate dehydrogenase [Verrucomicrobiae bacterium]|nr:type I glyceraldehyde-3-phosphate dehydrogenase [Verrucomicrobiae bacterium]
MAIRIGINGFGRIGRMVFRIMEADDRFEVVALNDLAPAASLAHLLKYDSVAGRFDRDVSATENSLIVGGREIRIHAEKDPAALPWGDLGVDFAVESTGIFTTRAACEKHLQAGAKKVLLTVPAKDAIDATIVMGVNQDELSPDAKIISNASCTTNCLAPVAKALNDAFGIEHGLMTTVHAYTNDQKILDMPHSDLRRARAAAMSIIPTTTGAAKAVSLVIPDLKGRFDGYALRVPTSTVSVVDFTAELEKETTTEELRQAFRDAAKQPRNKGVMQAVDEPLVSIDYKGDPHSSSVDLQFTMVLGKEKSNLVKIVTWYDNEWGYSCRTADLAALMAKSL